MEKNRVNTVWISNISYRTTSRGLLAEFEKFGKVERVDLPMSARENRPKGYAFIQFLKYDDAEYAIKKMHGTILDGRQIVCEWAGAPPKRKVRGFQNRRDNRRPSYRERDNREYSRHERPRYERGERFNRGDGEFRNEREFREREFRNERDFHDEREFRNERDFHDEREFHDPHIDRRRSRSRSPIIRKEFDIPNHHSSREKRKEKSSSRSISPPIKQSRTNRDFRPNHERSGHRRSPIGRDEREGSPHSHSHSSRDSRRRDYYKERPKEPFGQK
ncbi:u1 small nuclear ribonucleoprotein 70 kd [Anaeramoeba ignava]|uniref:U1 small nuclear ribonucleoprotein 70 kd n=1 Tax=Anaeramoeba ignava TaxID=1746090 RepID=A0A9Q0LUN8_ANAIG|nr:u1 small nuclear ribonucleoprotein 70 kd [Anaeramoeba ignava]